MSNAVRRVHRLNLEMIYIKLGWRRGRRESQIFLQSMARCLIRKRRLNGRLEIQRSTMNINRIRDFFDQDKFAKMVGAFIQEVSDGEVVCTLELNDNHLNAAGIVQGGVVFTLADFAFAVASNLEDWAAGTGAVTISQSSNITFFRPAKGEQLIARTSCLQKGRKISVYRVAVTDNSGANVAEMTGNAYRIIK